MKMKPCLSLCSALVLTLAGSLFAPDLKAEPSAMASEMETIATLYASVERQLPDAAQNASSLKQLTALIDASVRAQGKEPAGAAKRSGREREAFLKDYRTNVQLMIEILTATRTAVELQQNDTARALLATLQPMTGRTHSNAFK